MRYTEGRCGHRKPVARLAHLPVFAGMPVPYVVKWVDGKPDFRQTDVERWLEVIIRKRCAMCGKPLSQSNRSVGACYWIGGKGCFDLQVFIDGAMHFMCAVESMRLCPFLNGTRKEYRGELAAHPAQDTSTRPAVMYLMRGRIAAIKLIKFGPDLAIASGPVEIVREF